MKYFICEIPDNNMMRGAWGKARRDINKIMLDDGYQPLQLVGTSHAGIQKYIRHFRIIFKWKKLLQNLKRGDILAIQYPPLENSAFLSKYINEISQRGVIVILIIHDLVSELKVSGLKKWMYAIEEPKLFNIASFLIVHNKYMAKKLKCNKKKMISLNIFDYLLDDFSVMSKKRNAIEKKLPIIVAGNLSPDKTGYLYNLPDNCEFNLYGGGYIDTNKNNIHYIGSFAPDVLPYELSGSFGLIWDGDNSKNCGGVYGEYLRINNPHKTSLYLASGIPVIIWREAAMADFIIQNGCGLVVDSIWDIPGIINNISEEKYHMMKDNVDKIGNRIRKGMYLKAAINKCEISMNNIL